MPDGKPRYIAKRELSRSKHEFFGCGFSSYAQSLWVGTGSSQSKAITS